jgi:drug/metabolite transporter (DMT)-like permease
VSLALPGSSVARRGAVARRAWIAWVAVCLIWGTTYLAIKIALETLPPFLMGGLRYAAAGVGLAAIIALRRRPLPAISTWPRLAVLGFFMIGFGNGGVVIGSQWLPSGLTAVLIATSPFWMVSVEAAVSGGKQLRLRQWAGLAVGFLGILILVWPNLRSGGQAMREMLWGVVAVQMACAGWAVGSAYTRRHVMPSDVLGAAAFQMFFGGIFMLIAGTFHGEWVRLAFSPRTAWAFAYLTLAGSIIAFAAYSYALRHMDVAVVSLYTYINPVIAVALGAVVLGEPLGWRTLAAAGLIAIGVIVVGPGEQK